MHMAPRFAESSCFWPEVAGRHADEDALLDRSGGNTRALPEHIRAAPRTAAPAAINACGVSHPAVFCLEMKERAPMSLLLHADPAR